LLEDADLEENLNGQWGRSAERRGRQRIWRRCCLYIGSSPIIQGCFFKNNSAQAEKAARGRRMRLVMVRFFLRIIPKAKRAAGGDAGDSIGDARVGRCYAGLSCFPVVSDCKLYR